MLLALAVLLLIVAVFGGLAVHPLLFLLLVLAIIAFAFYGHGHYGRRVP